MTAAPPPIAMSVPEAAQACSLSERQMWRILKAENIPTRKLGRRTLVLYDGLKNYIEGLPQS
ncbi:MAG: helix-turn-helix domain-containing protein [Robiginitomaculum sp.]|nr:helix-turn-helix domain-containing protein [Robiginitomaculum sp.]